MQEIPFGGQALPGPNGKLTALHSPPSWIKGSLLLREAWEGVWEGNRGRDGSR